MTLPLDRILPPDLLYPYFRHAGEHPFEPRAEAFSLINAGWLADLSLLAYAERGFAEPLLRGAAGLDRIELLSGGGSTQCYVAANRSVVLVAFRGTEIKPDPADPLRGLRAIGDDIVLSARFKQVPEAGGEVHRGFLQGLEQVWNELEPLLERLGRQEPAPTFWFTGHSLGGALAVLAALRFRRPGGLYTYGAPRVGDPEFERRFDLDHAYRFVHHHDFVTELPPRARFGLLLPRYEHAGALKYVTWRGGEILDSLTSRSRVADVLRRRYQPLLDHAPTFYATYLWERILAAG